MCGLEGKREVGSVSNKFDKHLVRDMYHWVHGRVKYFARISPGGGGGGGE